MLRDRNFISFGASILFAVLFVAFSCSYGLAENDGSSPLMLEAESSIPGMHRLQMDVALGEVIDTYLDEKGHFLFIQLAQNADLVSWEGRLQDIKSQSALFNFIDLREIRGVHYVVIGTAKPLVKIEETVAMSIPGKVSWEVVLAVMPDEMVKALTPAPVVKLNSLTIEKQLRTLKLKLTGNADLSAEVFFDEHSGALIIQLPGVGEDQIDSLLPQEIPQQLGEVAIKQNQEGVTQLVFLPPAPLDVVDSKVHGDNETKVVEMSIVLVKDGPPSSTAEEGLQSLSLDEKNGLELSFQAEGEITPNAYVLLNPARLMVDLIGLSPQAVEGVVVGTALEKRLVDRIRYGSTRLGSARLEFSLKPEYLEAMGQSAVPFLFAEGRGIKVSLPAVEHEMVATTSAQAGEAVLPMIFPQPVSVPLTYSPEIVLEKKGKVAMGSVNLSAERYDSDEPMAPLSSGVHFSLMSLFTEALQRDPKFQAAKAEYTANMEAGPQALSGYLPQVAFNYQYSTVAQDVHDSSTISLGNYNYYSQSWNLTLTQPIFRMPAIIKLDQAGLSQQQAKLVLLSAEQDLILRVATSYLDVLAAFDALQLSVAEQQALLSHYQLAKKRYESGLGNHAQLLEAQSRVAIIDARKIEAEYRLQDARLALKQIVGLEVDGVNGFKADFYPASPFPPEVEPWVKAAFEQNLSLQTRRFSSKISALEVRKQKAGHYPTVDLTASAGQQDDEKTLYADGRQYLTNYRAGVQFNLPIYEGGMTASLVREAKARELQSRHEEDFEWRQTERLVRTAFLGVKASASMVNALRAGVNSRSVEIEAKTVGLKAGFESIVSVLDSYQDYFSARRDFLQSRYDYLLNRLKLKQAVGSLSRQDLISLDTLLNEENLTDE